MEIDVGRELPLYNGSVGYGYILKALMLEDLLRWLDQNVFSSTIHDVFQGDNRLSGTVNESHLSCFLNFKGDYTLTLFGD